MDLGDEARTDLGTNKKKIAACFPGPLGLHFYLNPRGHGGNQSMTAETLDAVRHPSAHIQIEDWKGRQFLTCLLCKMYAQIEALGTLA